MSAFFGLKIKQLEKCTCRLHSPEASFCLYDHISSQRSQKRSYTQTWCCQVWDSCCSYIKSQRSTSLNSRHDVRVVLCADSRGHRKTYTQWQICNQTVLFSCTHRNINTHTFIYTNSTSLSFSDSLMYSSTTHTHAHTQSTYHLHPTLSPMVQKEPNRSGIVTLWLSSLCALDVGGILLIAYQH